jgi:uncharacterized protein YqeY
MKNKITIKDLKKDRLKALKNNEKEKALTIMMLIDTIEKMAKVKNSDPNLFLIDGVKKYLKELEDAKENGVNCIEELKIIKEYAEKILPPQLNETNIIHIITELINDDPGINFGYIMKYFNIHYKNRVNMKMVQRLAKEILNSKQGC